jgi:uncharacterized protein YqgC (DUF456 family)
MYCNDTVLTGIAIVVAVLFLLGLAGSVLPFLPGTPLILAGAVLYAFATDFTPVGPGRLLVLGALTALSFALHYLAGAIGARRSGGSRWAVMGAIVGALVGAFFGPFGLFLGPFLGAAGFELLHRPDVETSVRAGIGTVLGMLVGVLANFSVAVVMVALFVWWVWRA